MKRNPFKWLAAFLLTVVVILSVVAYIFLGVDRDAEKKKHILIAEMVNNVVLEDLSEPITVSRMVSQDPNLREMLESENKFAEDVMVRRMRNYLSSVQRKFEFTSVYVISDTTKRYYSYIGLNKIIDPEHDSFDTWYTIFLDGGKDYELESSTDQVNLDRLTVFVDGRVENEEGELLGVSGVGVETQDILKLLSTYEDEYGVMIDYVSADGMVQMSSQTMSVHSSYVSGVDLPDKSDTAFHYQPYGIDGFSVVKYVPEIGWYLVVRSEEFGRALGGNYRFFFAEVMILVLAIAFLFIASKGMRTTSVIAQAGGSVVDDLTGLPNRDYLLKIYGEKGTLKTMQYRCMAVFSIDDYEEVEELPGFERMIHSLIRTAREKFGQKGQLVRWHRSTFVVLLEPAPEEAEEMCKDFCKSIEAIGEVTVSVGLTNIALNETLKKNYYRAARNLYLVKELGGNNVKRG
ncbi:MAG: diguanylate cyclase [Lachnospiraceae bacterium]|nr:diguanylate cyclase [Lachnospiraceae bacterium]